MKFVVLALCVCAASAASYGESYPRRPTYQAQQVAKAAAQTFGAPVAAAAAVASAPFFAPNAVAEAPVVAAKAVYNEARQFSGKDYEASIVRSDSDVSPDGFNFYYETNNGIAAQATGATKRVGNEDFIAVQGSYTYYTPEGRKVQLSYVADENGFQPQSDILPVGPPVPEAILRSLEYIRTHPSKEVY